MPTVNPATNPSEKDLYVMLTPLPTIVAVATRDICNLSIRPLGDIMMGVRLHSRGIRTILEYLAQGAHLACGLVARAH